jgi:ABC-type nickel/cobalt efflux system permease component RcnA
MLFAVALKVVAAGIIAVVAMSLGMGAVLAAVGLLCVFARSRITRFLRDETRGRRLELVLHWAGGLVVLVLGTLLLVANL